MHRLLALLSVAAACGAVALAWGGCASQPGDDGAGGAGVEGWVYATAARSRAAVQGNNFVLSSTADPTLGSAPTGSTTVSLGGGYQTTVDSNGHYAISGVTPGVYDLQVVQETASGLFFSDVFESIVVTPGEVTLGAVVPAGYAVRLDQPADASLEAGETLTLTAELIATATGDPVEGFAGPFTWTSSDAAVATVTAQGVVTGRRAGSAAITASAGSLSDSVTLTVTGGNVSDTVDVSLALTTKAAGTDTEVSAFTVSMARGSLSVPAGSLMLVTSPSGALAAQATPETTATTLDLPDPVVVTGEGTMLVTVRAPAGAALEFDDGIATVTRLEQFQLRCTVVGPGQTLFPQGVTLSLPGDGALASSARATFTGVSSTAVASLALEPGGILSGAPDATGTVVLSGFDATPASTLQAVRVGVLAAD